MNFYLTLDLAMYLPLTDFLTDVYGHDSSRSLKCTCALEVALWALGSARAELGPRFQNETHGTGLNPTCGLQLRAQTLESSLTQLVRIKNCSKVAIQF